MVWNATSGKCVVGPFQGHTDFLTSVTYSPNGACILSASDDNTIRVWNATTGQCVVGPLQGHTKGVLSVAYSPDGRYIVSGSEDNTIRVECNQWLMCSRTTPGAHKQGFLCCLFTRCCSHCLWLLGQDHHGLECYH